MKLHWCNFELHTKGEYEKSFKSDTLASFGWIILAVTVLLGTAVAIENSGILSNDLFSEPNTTKDERKMSTEQIAFDIHYEVNEVRKLHGLKPQPWSSTIAEIAKKHSQDMSERNYLSHISPEGNDVAYRYEQANFVCARELSNGDILKGAENLAEISYPDDLTGIGTRIVQSWMDSPSHKQNLLFKEYGKEGIGVVISEDVLYITQNFC
ncbi:MAG: CAP domain-containing protein [Nitrosopumilaceae archaeon]